jgi:proteasome lid subunit RPN8/RPN11
MRTIAEDLYVPLYQHAMQEYPKESCGLIVDGYIENLVVHGQYVPMKNSYKNPTEGFYISKRDIEPYLGRITALAHSHPDADPVPSAADMNGQMNMAVPWIILSTNGSNCSAPFAFGEQLGDIPLEDRYFRHGVTDCYDAIKDYCKQKRGIILPNFPRDWGWWDNGGNLYEKGFTHAGFRRIKADTPEEISQLIEPHDVFLLSMRSNVANHGGIYLGDGLLYHHLGSERSGPYSPKHRSKIESAMRWMDYRPTILRYGLNEND